MATNADYQKQHRTKLANMVRYGAKLTTLQYKLINKRSGDTWEVQFYWPDYHYYQISRTYTSHGRDYTKSHLISSKVLETNYVEIASKAA